MGYKLQLDQGIKRIVFQRRLSGLPEQSVFSKLLPCIAIACAYFLGSQLGFLFLIGGQPLSAIWPPNAILLAGLLLLPWRLWGCALLCVLPAHMLAQLMDGVSIHIALVRYVTNASEAVIGAAAIRYFVGSNFSFEHLRDTAVFLIGGVIFAPVASSVFDIFTLQTLRLVDGEFWVLWRNRVLSNAVSVLVLVPVIVAAVQRQSWKPLAHEGRRRVEAVVLMVVLFSICTVGFLAGGAVNVFHGAILFSLFPVMIWAATRFGAELVSAVILVVALFGIWGALHWQGPFIKAASIDNLLWLYFFLLFSCAPLLLLAAVIGEWRTADGSARKRKQQLDLALSVGKLNLWKWEIEGSGSDWSSRIRTDARGDETADMPVFFRQVHPDDRKKFEDSLTSALVFNEPFELEVRIADAKDSSYRWFSSRGFWQLYPDGKPFRLLGVNADITQHKNEYAQIQRQRDELAHLSRVAMLGEMSGAIAHELNQPLTAILSNSQAALRMLKKSPSASDEVAEILADIVSEDKRASEIIKRMREFIKKGPAKLERADINELIGKAVALERSDLISKNVAIKATLAPTLPVIMVDSIQILQVLLNLIINACDAMQGQPTNERLIQITTSRQSEKLLLITVSDRGKGIAESELESIFEPFVTSKSHGLGLGLTICRSIIEAHGGRLWARNNREGGATFSLILPVLD